MVYARLTKAEHAALAELAASNRRRVADEAAVAVVDHLRRHGVAPSVIAGESPGAGLGDPSRHDRDATEGGRADAAA
jgi:hypothetical protein